jgi:uncharacterized protein YciI
VPLFVVEQATGPEWDPSRDVREQEQWDEHAAFMDGLVDDGLILLGGPFEGGGALHIVDAESEEEVRARFGADPWAGTILRLDGVRPWRLWLRGQRPVP